MNYYATLIRTLALVVTTFVCGELVTQPAEAAYTPPTSSHVDFNFNYDWLFVKQNVQGGASAVAYNESAMQAVSLPHTWNDDKFREWIFISNDTKADPLRPSGTYYGVAWYRKHFTIPTTYSGNKILLEFQGIGRVGSFWVNGQYVGINESGVAPVGLDITPYVTFGADNVIAVEVNNDENYHTVGYNGAILPFGQPFNPNFGGINRDVTLHICNKLYQTLPLYRNLGTEGTYIYPSAIDTLNKTATINFQSEVENDNTTSQTATCEADVVDNTGTVVFTQTSAAQSIAVGQKFKFTFSGNLTGIHFWDPTYPYMYTVYTIIKNASGTVTDVRTTPLGVRTYVFNPTFGLEVNGHPLYLNGYAPRCSMEWPAVGTPVDWMNEYDFQMMRASNANFVRPMHIAPRKVQVEAADKYGIIMVCPAANNEGDDTDANIWQERLDDMRDVTIYYRNNPSVLFYEGCNQILTAQHMTDMLNVRKTWDPSGGRLSGLRSNDGDVTQGIREYSCTMDGAEDQLTTPLWDAEYARAEGPRRVWDNYTPMYNPRWDGVNSSNTPFSGTNTTSKYLIGGYFNIASLYHQAFGLNSGNGDFIGDYLFPILQSNGTYTNAYFRVQNSEDMVMQNQAKYFARVQRSVFMQSASTSATKGVNTGGAKIIWSDSVTDGRMHDMEVTRTSGAVDGARLPKEVYYGMQVAQNPNPETYVLGHWNYASGTVKTVYVVSNTSQVDLQTYNASGTLIKDYGMGNKSFFPTSIFSPNGDQVNNYVFAFPNVAWQAGSIKATGYDNSGVVSGAPSQKSTAGAPASLKLTPTVGPSGHWMADGSDIAWYDVEVVDAQGNRCPTYQDNVTFSCSGAGIFLGGYNSGIRYSTNLANLTSGYSLQLECGINRVFVRSTRTAGSFTLNVTGVNNVTGANFSTATSTISSVAVTDTNGLSTVWPQKYTVPLGTEPTPVAEGTPPPIVTQVPVAPATDVVSYAYSGGNTGSNVVENVQAGQQVYVDKSWTLPTLPTYLQGSEFIQPYQADAGATSATDQYQFNLTKFSYIYLAIDSANNMPANDNNNDYEWQKLTDTITVNGRVMNIYKSRLMQPYEDGYFADNGYGNSQRFSSSSNMYLVFIQNAEQQLQAPTDTVTVTDFQAGHGGASAVDGDTSTRWNAADGTFPKVLTVDLGRECAIGGYTLNWYNNATRYAQFKVEVSDDNVNFSTSLDMSQNQLLGVNEFLVPSTAVNQGRYVRFTFENMSGGGWAAVSELQIFGVPASMLAPPPSTVLSTGLTATASSSATNHGASLANDGDTSTYWSASGTTYPQTWTVDLGQVQSLTNVDVVWPNSSSQAYQYKIDVSNDNSAFSNVVTKASNTTVGETSDNFNSSGRFVRVTVTGSSVAGVAAGANEINVSGYTPSTPLITSSLVASGNATVAFSYQITGTSNPTGFAATGLPSGLTLNSTTGVISGTPATSAVGTSVVTISATNSAGTGTAALNLTINPAPIPPTVNSPTTATATVATAFSYQITGTNGPTSFAATGLPTGLSVNATTGVISGTPIATGSSTIAVTATNTFGTSPSANVTLNVVAGSYTNLALNKTATSSSNFNTTNTAPQAVDGSTSTRWESQYSDPQWITVDLGQVDTIHTVIIDWDNACGKNYNLQASNDNTNWTDIVTPIVGNTKSGVTAFSGLNAVGRYVRMYGTVRNLNYGYSIYEFQVWGTTGSNGSGSPVVNGTLTATGTVNTAFSYQISATNSPTSYSATGLPAGLTLNASTGLITGTPTAAGTSTVTVSATNASGTSPTASLTITVNPTFPTITSALTATGTLGSAFSYHIQATNSPTSYSATGLPAGLTVNTSSGAISGTPTATGQTSVTLTATNVSGTSVPATLVITVNGIVPVITSQVTAIGTAGTAFTYQMAATNTPTSFSATGLPAGLSLNTTSGLISGTPTAAATSNIGLSASNANGTGPTTTLVLTVNPATPAVTSALTANGVIGSAFSYHITASNSPTSFNATGLPAGLTVNTTTGVISGTPTAAGTVSVSLTASNAGGTSTPKTLSLTIAASGDINLALNQTATASSFEAGNTVANANDGNSTGTRWSASGATYPQWWMVDLGANKTLSRCDIAWYGGTTRAYKYKIEVSTDNVNFTTVKDNTANTTDGNTSDSFTATARYVRVTVTGSSSGWASAYEIGVYGH